MWTPCLHILPLNLVAATFVHDKCPDAFPSLSYCQPGQEMWCLFVCPAPVHPRAACSHRHPWSGSRSCHAVWFLSFSNTGILLKRSEEINNIKTLPSKPWHVANKIAEVGRKAWEGSYFSYISFLGWAFLSLQHKSTSRQITKAPGKVFPTSFVSPRTASQRAAVFKQAFYHLQLQQQEECRQGLSVVDKDVQKPGRSLFFQFSLGDRHLQAVLLSRGMSVWNGEPVAFTDWSFSLYSMTD